MDNPGSRIGVPGPVLIMAQNSVLTGGTLMFVFGLEHGLAVIPFSVATGEMKGRLGNRYIKTDARIKTILGAVVIILICLFADSIFGNAIW